VPRLRLALLIAGLCLLAASPAEAAISKDQAVAIATRLPQVRAELASVPAPRATVSVDGDHYVVLLGSSEAARAEVDIDILSGRVLRVFLGDRAEFPLARGPASGFAQRKLNAVWLWIPLTLIFVFAFFDRRRPFRLLHLDLAAIALLGVSYAFWMKGNLSASVPLVYPPLVYLVARSLLAGLGPRQRGGPITWLPARAVIALTLGLVALRVGLTLADTFVSDIGYGSAAGAQRILDGLQLYTRGGAHFDTYGPLAYLLYIPFVLIWPFHESQTYPPAAEAAGIVWELITVAGLVVLGRQFRLGWTLALVWAACPFTALAVVCGSNDGLVAALLVWTFVAFRSPLLRGGLAGAAAAAKFAPGFVLPVLARGTGRMNWRRAAICLVAATAVAVVSLIPLLPPGGFKEFYDTTIGFQLHRHSPFSIWSQHPSLDWLQALLKAGSLALPLVLMFVPRGARSLAQVAAFSAAVLVAAQLPLQHWFYLYIPWVLPLYCVALFSEHAAGARSAASQP
jgi:hypothetical protein